MKSPRTLIVSDAMALVAPDASASSPVSMVPVIGARPDRIDVPEHLQSSVVVAMSDNAGDADVKAMIYIDHRVKSSAAVRTWLKRLDELKIGYAVDSVTVDALERLRGQHAIARRDDPM